MARVGVKRKTAVEKTWRKPSAAIRDHRTGRISLPLVCECRVDRTGLCVKFPASASVGQTLSKL